MTKPGFSDSAMRFDFMGVFLRFVAHPSSHTFVRSEREAVAAQAEETGVAVARGVDARKQLMRGVGATVALTAGVVLVLLHRHSGTRDFPNVDGRTIAAEVFHGR